MPPEDYITGVIRNSSEVGLSTDKRHTVASDRGKTHHVLYSRLDERIETIRMLLGRGFESKTLDGLVVIFLTQTEADKLVVCQIAISKSDW